MDVQILRKQYARLTPFERAAMFVSECVGRKRDTEIDALLPVTEYNVLWMTHWQMAFFTVASYAMFNSCLCYVAYFEALHSFERRKAAELLSNSLGWIRAMKELEKETGARFLDSSNLINKEYLAAMLEEAGGCTQEAWEAQYRALRVIWDSQFQYANVEDQGRKLPPLPDAGMA